MVFGAILERFVPQAPACVMVRATLEHVFAPAKLNAVFETTTVQQYTRELLFSTVVDLMSLVVRRIHPSLHAAYVKKQAAITVSVQALDEQLKEPICMASLCRLSEQGKSDRNRLLFANPDNLDGDRNETAGRMHARKNLTVKLSYDEGRTWPVARVLEPGTSGYNDLAVGPDGTSYCLYERGSTDGKNHFATRTLWRVSTSNGSPRAKTGWQSRSSLVANRR